MAKTGPQFMSTEAAKCGAVAGEAVTPGDEARQLLSRDDIEREYRITKRWLELAALKGNGPPYLRISRRFVRYRRGDFENWLSGHEYRSTSEVRE